MRHRLAPGASCGAVFGCGRIAAGLRFRGKAAERYNEYKLLGYPLLQSLAAGHCCGPEASMDGRGGRPTSPALSLDSADFGLEEEDPGALSVSDEEDEPAWATTSEKAVWVRPLPCCCQTRQAAAQYSRGIVERTRPTTRKS